MQVVQFAHRLGYSLADPTTLTRSAIRLYQAPNMYRCVSRKECCSWKKCATYVNPKFASKLPCERRSRTSTWKKLDSKPSRRNTQGVSTVCGVFSLNGSFKKNVCRRLGQCANERVTRNTHPCACMVYIYIYIYIYWYMPVVYYRFMFF